MDELLDWLGTARADRMDRNLGDPAWRRGESSFAPCNERREYITADRLCRESEGFIVAVKRVTTVERRNPVEDMFS